VRGIWDASPEENAILHKRPGVIVVVDAAALARAAAEVGWSAAVGWLPRCLPRSLRHQPRLAAAPNATAILAGAIRLGRILLSPAETGAV
jgi:hypothetical protein